MPLEPAVGFRKNTTIVTEDENMLTATSEKIRSQQERWNASLRAAFETIRQSFLEHGAAIIAAQRKMLQDLHEEMRQGLERQAFLTNLAGVRSQAEGEVKLFKHMFGIFENDPVTAGTIELQLREAVEFLVWVRELEGQVSTSIPSFDESRLTPSPDGPTAAGYLAVSEAQAHFRSNCSIPEHV